MLFPKEFARYSAVAMVSMCTVTASALITGRGRSVVSGVTSAWCQTVVDMVSASWANACAPGGTSDKLVKKVSINCFTNNSCTRHFL